MTTISKNRNKRLKRVKKLRQEKDIVKKAITKKKFKPKDKPKKKKEKGETSNENRKIESNNVETSNESKKMKRDDVESSDETKKIKRNKVKKEAIDNMGDKEKNSDNTKENKDTVTLEKTAVKSLNKPERDRAIVQESKGMSPKNEMTSPEKDIDITLQKLASYDAKHIRISNNKDTTKKQSSKNNVITRKKDIEIGDFTLLGSVDKLRKERVARVLPYWLNHPVLIKRSLKASESTSKLGFLDHRTIRTLDSNGVSSLFPVQSVVIPEILKGTVADFRYRPRDICVASPTGSGKTLAYVLPIVQSLSSKNIRRIRAIVILPVVELAKQVYDVFSKYAKPFGLRIGRIFGSTSFEEEQRNIIENRQGCLCSKVDIIIATPGRLSDHISNTTGLDFSELRFLVFDEADQLFTGDFSEIISRIQRFISNAKKPVANFAISPCFHPLIFNDTVENSENSVINTSENKNKDNIENKPNIFSTRYIDKIEENLEEGSSINSHSEFGKDGYFVPQLPGVPLQRLLFSATLSTRPQELQNISLYRPILYTAEHGKNIAAAQLFSARGDHLVGTAVRPDSLTEQYTVTTVQLKPLMLHYIIHKERKGSDTLRILVFASSIALTLKATVLLKAMSRGKYSVEGFTSIMNKDDRGEMVDKFRKGDINVLVSSDAMARGMDLPDVDVIISFDVPSQTTYIHRIGRTARAGKEGVAISIVTEDEISEFKKIFGSSFSSIKQLEVPPGKLEKFENRFRMALETLKTETRSHPKNLPKSMKKSKFGDRRKGGRAKTRAS